MKKIAIIMGGYSSEYKISLTSGNVVYQNLDKTKFKGYRIHIFKDFFTDMRIDKGWIMRNAYRIFNTFAEGRIVRGVRVNFLDISGVSFLQVL